MLPDYIRDQLAKDGTYYSLHRNSNIIRAQNDPEYLNDVLIANESLIWHAIYKYIGKPDKVANIWCVEVDDMIQHGRIAFVRSVKLFDVSKGFKFSTYAVLNMVREINNFLKKGPFMVSPPKKALDLHYKISRIESQFGKDVTSEFLSEILGVPVVDVNENRAMCSKAVFVDTQEIERLEEKAISPDSSEGYEEVEAHLLKTYMIDAVRHRLTETEVSLLELKCEGLSQIEIAHKLNVSPMYVSRHLLHICNVIKEEGVFKHD